MSSRWLFSAVLAAGTSTAVADTPTEAALRAEVDALRARLEQLEARLQQAAPATGTDPSVSEREQRLLVLERKFELQQEEALARATTAPVVAVGDKGLSVKTPKGDYEIKIRGLVHADYRAFFDDEASNFNDGFLFRRIRPSIEGSLGSLLAFRLTPEFAGDSASIVDAYVDLRFDPAYTVRAGKIKGPVGLERLQSGAGIALIERAFPTELAPNRDLGVQLQGDLAGSRVNYAVGVFNGAPDGRDAPTSDADDNLEYAARVFFEPWKNDANALSGLGFGIAASAGEKDGTGNNLLPRYRSPGQNVFFNYRSAVAAHGSHTRWSPQFYYYRNAFGLQGEYIESEQELLLPGVADSRTRLAHSAWQLTGSWVLTGEDGSFRGVAKPSRPFGRDGGWGAFELVGRYGELDVDDDAFPRYADPSTAASRAQAWGIGLNWFLTSNLKLAFNHTHASFDGGAPSGGDRPDEKTFFSRLQIAF